MKTLTFTEYELKVLKEELGGTHRYGDFTWEQTKKNLCERFECVLATILLEEANKKYQSK